MSTSITWPPIGGTSYSVPASGESNWPTLSNFLIALAAAQGTTAQKIGVRVATSSPVTVVSATDCVVVTNLAVAGAVAVTLPAGVTGQQFVIIDGKGDAATNNITITPNGAETINGAATFVINGNRSGVALAFTGSGNWTVLSQSGGSSITVDYIDFTGVANPVFQEGRLFYDNTNDTLSFYNAEADIKLDIGEENWVKVRNNTGSTILDGQAVYINGALGQNPTVTLAQANTSPTSRTIGLATHNIENNTNGYITVFGIVRDLDTSAFSDGAILYLSASTPGALTATAPTAPNYAVSVGVVAHSHVTLGKILVHPDNSNQIGLGTANQVLGVNSGATLEEYKTIQGTTDEIIITHGAGTITVDADATAVGTANKLVKRDATGGSAFDYVDHDGQGSAPSYVAGRMWYDTVDNTMRYYNDSATDSVNIGQEINVKVRNTSGSTMTAGQVVYVTGAVSNVPTVSLALASAFATSRIYAVVTETITNNTNGYATICGLIKNLNLAAFADGDALYLSSTVAGALTATRPSAPNYVMPIGTVASNSSTVGRLIVELVTRRIIGYGTANQMVGMNSAGTEQEYKTVSGTTGQVSVLHAANSIKLGLDDTTIPNYIANGSFEQTANAVLPAGWVQYNDGAVAIPVDGTGGSAVAQVTFLASTSSPIRGTTSAVLTKDAANRQGVGYAYAITLQNVDRTKKLNIQTELTVSSGTYAAGDLAFYVYDVTNSVVITPTVAAIPSITNKWVVNFDTTTSTSYRLLIHIASTSASAYTMQFDTMSVDAGDVSQGAAVSEQISFTPSVTTGLGTITASTLQYRRVGSNLHMSGRFACGTVTASNAELGLPAGLTTATNGATTQVVGKWAKSLATANTYKQGVVVITNGVAYVNFSIDDYTTAINPVVIQNANTIFGNTDTIYFDGELIIPIAQWQGSGTLTQGQGAQQEFVANSGNVTAAGGSDSSSFVSGMNGTPFLSYASTTANSTTDFTVQFAYPMQADEKPQVQIYNGVGWFDAETLFNSLVLNTAIYGIQVTPLTSTTARVSFGNQGARPSGAATYAASGQAWSVFSGLNYRWRVVKAKASAPVGFGLASESASGIVNPYLPGSGVVYAGRYTPTLASISNATTGASYSAHYSRVGKIVTVSGLMVVTTGATLGGLSVVRISLPIASTPTQSFDCLGVGNWLKGPAGSTPSSPASGQWVTGSNIDFTFYNTVINFAAEFTYTFQYEIK